MKKYSIFLLLFLLSYSKPASSQVTKKIIIENLTGQTGSKAWFITGTTANSPDRSDGDMKYVFEKNSKLFKVYRCNQLKKWIQVSSQSWEILNYDPESKSPLHFDLKIGGKVIYYDFKPRYSKLYLQLHNWKERKILF